MAFASKDISDEKRTGLFYKGKEIVLGKKRGPPVKGLVAKGMERGIYPMEKQVEACTIYAATGNPQTCEELTGVPAKVVREWRKEGWFQDLMKEIRDESNEKNDVIFTQIIETALAEVQDRLQNGEAYVQKDGTIGRKPVSVRDLALVAAINIDKRELLRGKPTSRVESVGEQGKLEKLAEMFTALTQKKRPEKIVNPIEGEINGSWTEEEGQRRSDEPREDGQS